MQYWHQTFFEWTIIRDDIPNILSNVRSLFQLWQFYKDEQNHLGSARRSVIQSIENAQANVNWMENNFETISGWLQNTSLHLSQYTNEVD